MFNRYGMQRVDHSRTAPAPMPDVRAALIPMKDAKAAIDRALDAWNPTQMQDAIRSAEFFIAQAKQALEAGATYAKPPAPPNPPPAPSQPHGYHGTHIEPPYPWPR